MKRMEESTTQKQQRAPLWRCWWGSGNRTLQYLGACFLVIIEVIERGYGLPPDACEVTRDPSECLS